jgi:hypothetical protein
MLTSLHIKYERTLLNPIGIYIYYIKAGIVYSV